MKYLKFYEDCMQTGVIPDNGLCNSLKRDKISLFEPEEVSELFPNNYWGYGESTKDKRARRVATEFTTLRQTITLFVAAMEGEL
jgi:hypothetical protein